MSIIVAMGAVLILAALKVIDWAETRRINRLVAEGVAQIEELEKENQWTRSK